MALELSGSRYDESMPVVSAGDLLLINAHTKEKNDVCHAHKSLNHSEAV
jgi:hypothetical protein